MTITVQKHNVVVTTIIGLKLLRHQQIRSFQHNEKSKYTKEKNVMILYIQHRAWRRLRMGPKIQEQPKKRLLAPKIKNFSNFRDLFKKTQRPRNLNSLRKVPSSTKQKFEKKFLLF
jgi:hypothetical protein